MVTQWNPTVCYQTDLFLTQFVMENRMVPFSGAGLRNVFRVLDVDVPMYHTRHAGLSPPGHAAWVTSEDIKREGDRISKIRARHLTRNEQGYNSIRGFYRISSTVRP